GGLRRRSNRRGEFLPACRALFPGHERRRAGAGQFRGAAAADDAGGYGDDRSRAGSRGGTTRTDTAAERAGSPADLLKAVAWSWAAGSRGRLGGLPDIALCAGWRGPCDASPANQYWMLGGRVALPRRGTGAPVQARAS